MQRKKPSLAFVTPRDREILKYLFENKIATQKQLGNKFFPGKTKQAVSQRLLKLKKDKLIGPKGVVVNDSVRKCLVVKPNAVPLIKEIVPYTIDRDPLESDSPGHDLVLSSLIEKIRSCSRVTNVLTEAALQAYREVRDGLEFGAYSELRSDGVIIMDVEGKPAYAALEYDRNIKTRERYTKKLHAYYDQNAINGVLYVCESELMRDLIYRIDSKLRRDQSSKFFLVLRHDVQNPSDRVTFQNFKGQSFELRCS